MVVCREECPGGIWDPWWGLFEKGDSGTGLKVGDGMCLCSW